MNKVYLVYVTYPSVYSHNGYNSHFEKAFSSWDSASEYINNKTYDEHVEYSVFEEVIYD